MKSPFPSSLRRRAILTKRALLAVRGLNFLLAAGVSAVFITLLARHAPGPTSAKPEISVLLSFTMVTTIQSAISTVLTCTNHEKLWVAAIDLVCICGYVTTAVLLRGITSSYGCATWLEGGEGHGKNGSIMRRAHDGEAGECKPLRGVFGIAIIGCFLLLASFQLALYTVRLRKVIEERERKTARKLELGDVVAERKRNGENRTSRSTREEARRKESSGRREKNGRRNSEKRLPQTAPAPRLPEKPKKARTKSTDSTDTERRAFAKEIS